MTESQSCQGVFQSLIEGSPGPLDAPFDISSTPAFAKPG